MFEIICGIIIFIVLIFIIIAILGTSKNTKKMSNAMENQMSQMSQMDKSDRYCPDCGRAIPFDADICPYCGKNFNDIRKENLAKELQKEMNKN